MRRSGHPSRPRAITCCFFASLKTLLISTKATCLTPKSTSRAPFSLAGFQVTLIGRFWVTPEVKWDAQIQPNEIGVSVRDGVVSDAGSRFCRTAVAYEMHFPIPNASE